MGGPSWQDTAMHLSIIQSLTQGNFPPQAPYFSGQPLTYYYFSDFHAAIVNTLFGRFFPEILILLNPFFAATFFFSVFALSFELTHKKTFSIISGVMAVMYGNLGFINLIKDLIIKKIDYISLVTLNPYNFTKNYLQMTPMADYFLQNRPMMVGLPVFILVILLLLKKKSGEKNYLLKIFVAGILTASLLKFQLFGFVVCWVFFGIYFGINILFKKIKFFESFKYLLIFGISSLIIGIVFASENIGSRTLVQVFLQSFSWGPWQKHDPLWFIYFLITNLGLGFIIFLTVIFFKKFRRDTGILSIYLTSLILIVIPLTMKFTIYEFDMLKFYYYLIPLICVLLACLYAESNHKRFSIFIFIVIAIISSLSSVNMLIHSYLNKSEGYSYSDYEAGTWILSNTPQKSVFVTMPTVHSTPTDIGGRLRIISYINWPYSHGFNVGSDNVFSRVKDVTNVYETGDVGPVRLKYNAEYVFYGGDERGQFPFAGKYFDQNKNLKLIYNQDGIEIYKII
jgi:uncharacterized membrane protein